MSPSPQALAEGGPVLIDGFLTKKACAAILEELEFALWRPSTVVVRKCDGALENRRSGCRISETAGQEWFGRELARRIGSMETRLAAIVERPPERYEDWQATLYRPGGRFAPHLDAGHCGAEPAGEREWTALIYLDAPRRGGGTRFPALGLSVEPRAGRLVLWRNLLPDGAPDPRMEHAGEPVRAGRKTTLVTWIRQRAIRPAAADDFAAEGGPHGR